MFKKFNDPQKGHAKVIKFTTYSVASVLAVLLLTATLPPLVADQSDRAILDAPVTLLTSPIAGEVTALNVKTGSSIPKGTVVAEVENKRVDRSTLLTLQGKAADYQQALVAARSKKDADQKYLDALDKEIAAEKAQLISQFEDQNAGLKAMVSAAEAGVNEKGALRDRQISLVANDTVSPYMLKPTTQQLSAAKGTYNAAAAKLAASMNQLQAIKNDIFVGDNLVGIATLAQKRRDIAFDLEHQKIDEADAEAGLQSETKYIEAETLRIETVSGTQLETESDGEVLNIGAAVGRHVNPGDSLVTMVDCQNLVAVAIFSYRQASALSVGTHVLISTSEGSGDGVVQEIVPKANDKSDALYAFPFPQTERREMYVIIKPIAGFQSLPVSVNANGTCPVGRWVTVTRADGWVPSTSVLWRDASQFLVSLLTARDAEAQQSHKTNGS